MTDSLYWIWFQLVFGIGTRRSHSMLEYFSSPLDILEGLEHDSQIAAMLREEEIAASKAALEKAKEIQQRTLRKGCDIITPDHPTYPALLQNIYAKPAALYLKGDLSCLQDALVIAMVGTRTYSEYGRDAARQLAKDLAASGAVIVSGLAKGIDTFCHQSALDAGGYSIGILGCGIDVDYPKGSARVKGEMSKRGAVVTEYPLGTQPMPGNFPLRNRIISGMSHGVIVVEASVKSGSMLTATHALEQNREVFAVPGEIFSSQTRGNHQLIQEGCKLIVRGQDVLDEFSLEDYPKLKQSLPGQNQKPEPPESVAVLTQGPPRPQQTGMALDPPQATAELPEGCSANAREVYAWMKGEPQTVEELLEGSDLTVPMLQTALTELEIYGLIRGYPGRCFSL